MQRLGKNLGRYHGEAIDIDGVQAETHQLALQAGWSSEAFFERPGTVLRAYHRPAPGSPVNFYLSTGIHGDEPSGPLAVLELLREDRWPAVNLWLVPCLNPSGFRLNTRENGAGIDLNRDYRSLLTPEISTHVAWLNRQPRFDLTVLLHEDWEANGFYVYELNPYGRRSLAEHFVSAVRQHCPIESAELVDNFICRDGIIRPQFNPAERPQWAEAIYLAVHKSDQSYTLETPSDFPLPFRVQTHLRAVREAFRQLAG